MDQPFDRVDIGLRERPVSSDLNRAQSQIYRTITDLMQQLFGGSASPRSGFIGPALSINALSPAAMSVQVAAGMGFLYDATDLPADIGATDLESVDDFSPYKPIVLNAPVTFAVPTAPAGPNTRIDIIEVRVNRQLVDATPRQQLDVATKTFLPHSFFKTLTFSLDGFTGSVTSPASSTAALSYKVGTAGNPGVAPATTAGYIKLGEVHVGSGVATILAADLIDARALLIPTGTYIGRQMFTASGTYTPMPGTSRVRIQVCAGGGGGGGVTGGGGFATASGGGGSGNTIAQTIGALGGGLVTGGAVVIGAAGAGGAAGATGATGGDSSLVVNGVTYLAKGGSGGVGKTAVATTDVGLGGAPPSGSTATDYMVGNSGAPGIAVLSGQQGGAGGSSPFGIGGVGRNLATGGFAAGYGCGGGGTGTSGAINEVGGNGTGGIVIVDEYL